MHQIKLIDPDLCIDRKIRIWIRCDTESSTLLIKCNNHTQKLSINNKQHTPMILYVGYNKPQVEIECEIGAISIGHIETNYSWKINPKIPGRFAQTIKDLEKQKFDLSTCDPELLQRLGTESLFVSSGPDDFSAVANLKHRVCIDNDDVEPNREWYSVHQGQIARLILILTEPAITVEPSDYDIGSEINTTPVQIEEKNQKIDKHFFDQLNTDFFEFVDKKIANPWVSWDDCRFGAYELSYSTKFRIQKLLLDNKEYIENKVVVDFGCHQGQFLWPCVWLGCSYIKGGQPLPEYNHVINEALTNLKQTSRARAEYLDLYEHTSTEKILINVDTILLLGVIYHLNHHYQLLQWFTQSTASALIIDTSIFEIDHYLDSRPMIRWVMEKQGIDQNGWETNAPDTSRTWVGYPNSAWLIRTLESLGWRIKSNLISTRLNIRKSPAIRYKGFITAYR